MRVLHVYRTYFPDPPGGLQEAIRQIALATSMFGVENRIFTLAPIPIPIEIERPEGLVIRSKSWASPASCDLGLFDSLRQFKKLATWADLIHYHFPWPFADFLESIIKIKKPKVMTYHSDVVGKGILGHLYKPLMQKMIKQMDIVVATSPPYCESSPVLKSIVSHDRLRIIPLGIGEETYKDYIRDATYIDLKERFSLFYDSYILFIGVLRHYKGLDYLIDASKMSDFTIAIAGDGQLREQVSSAAQAFPNLRMLGRVSDAEKIALLKGCRALVLPSHLRSEAFGMVLVEASMFSKPLITCEIGTGTSFVNENELTGYVVNPESPKALATAINSLAENTNLARQMGTNAYLRYKQLFSGKALGDAYVNLYNEMLS